ncbi:MAG: hypothetical protein NXY57DRAFT_962096 [Lentinula lateritia]|uniref:Uncharacterized protein n=2 Tax=Lentinula TaxID=5352 RepID=A0ABQ8UYL7_9AGAR|nr:MAG: hypothetical protein NXY57DRAFT_962096 [Lentinula lateritia]KAJ4465710.1 hypothetical protein C8R41DRAFT_891120 [Lentinula lateritia]
MLYRERRSWTEEEDQLLRDAVDLEEPGSINPSKWHAIAKHVPSRTNKDCRKRWFAKMASDVVKGGWAPEEDEKLVQAIEKYGTRWSLVSAYVQTRNSDQCAKRWTDTLNPMIDRTRWSAEADALLLNAVQEHGKLWTKIVRIYFPGRTGLAAKNRYNSITRFSTRAPRRKSYKPRFESESASSSISNSPSISSMSSSSSTSDTSEPPSTPPSFELNTPLISDPNSEGLPSEFMLDSTTWSAIESASLECTSHCLPSTTFTYEDLCNAMASSSDLINDAAGLPDYSDSKSSQNPLSTLPWEDETYSHIQHTIDLCSNSAILSSSHPLDSFDTFLSYQNLDHSSTALSPLPMSSMSDTSSAITLLPADGETTNSLNNSSHVHRHEYGYATVPFWEPANSDPHSFLAQWTSTY